VEDLASRFEGAEAEFHRAYWDSQTHASDENDRRRAQAEIEVRALKGDRVAYRSVLDALEEEVHDPLIKRQLELLRASLAANQMDDRERAELVALGTSIESEFASFRPEVGGDLLSDNDIEEILKTSDEEATRRDVWLASKEIGGRVAGRIRELVRMRNKNARDLGYSDHYRMSLDLQELSEDWLFSVLDELEDLTQEPFERWKGELDAKLAARFGTDHLAPWHYADPFFQHPPPDGRIDMDPFFDGGSAPDLAQRTFTGWGLDIGPVLEASDLWPRIAKCQHAFCLNVDRSGDVRILANVVPGERWVEVLLHESGHAAYDLAIDPHLPWVLRRPAHTFVTEAIAILTGALPKDPRWLTDVAGVSVEDVTRVTDRLRAARAGQKILFARWGLLMSHFERDLYSDPEIDLDARWWELVERFQSIATPSDVPKGSWASKIHIAVAPVYYHNYLLGEILAAQLRGAIEDQCGSLVANPAVGEFLRDRVFRHGQLLRWDGLVESAVGKRLSARDLVASL